MKLHSHYIWHHTNCICVIKQSGSILSNAVYVWHHSHYVYDIICTTCDITSTVYDITPLYIRHQVHSILPHFHYIYVITPTLLMISQALYVIPHIQYICDITSTIFMRYYPLSMTSQNSVLMIQQSAYVLHPLHCRWQRTHSITPKHSIYDVTSPSGRTTQPLYQTSHPPSVWHHMNYI